MSKMSDRRIFKRVPGEFQVSVNKKRGKNQELGYTKNISGGGLCLSLFRKVRKGLMLELELLRRGYTGSFPCKGEVVWVARNGGDNRFDVGVRFTDTDLLYVAKLMKDLKGRDSLLSLGGVL